jgi:hypothetical protein
MTKSFEKIGKFDNILNKYKVEQDRYFSYKKKNTGQRSHASVALMIYVTKIRCSSLAHRQLKYTQLLDIAGHQQTNPRLAIPD